MSKGRTIEENVSTEATNAPPSAALAGVSKRFAATQALSDVSLDVVAGEIHALVGENGAGKSTIVKVFAGIYQPDAGTVVLDGKPTLLHGPAHARSLGIAVVHQEPRLFPDLTVAENVFMGHAPISRPDLRKPQRPNGCR
jgi:rhamnose transport system ATP-binding protein